MSNEQAGAPDAEQPRSKGFFDRFLRPPKDVPDEATEREALEVLSPDERKVAMRNMDRSEVRLGYIAAGVAFIFSILLTVPFMFGPTQTIQRAKPVHGKCAAGYALIKGSCTHVTIRQPSYYVLPLIVYVIFTIAILVTVRIRRRVPASFAAFLTGVAFTSTSIAIGAPLLIYGGWLFVRARRIQKYGTTDSRTVAQMAAEDRVARKAGQPLPSARAQNKPSAKGGTKPSAPEASKRYTPPRPKRKKPPAS
jgi:hypothetical protein